MEICFLLDKAALITQLSKLENHVAMFKYCVVSTICCGFTSQVWQTFYLCLSEFKNWVF